MLLQKLFEHYLFPNGESNRLLPYCIDLLFEVTWTNGCLRTTLTKDITIPSNSMKTVPINLYLYCHKFFKLSNNNSFNDDILVSTKLNMVELPQFCVSDIQFTNISNVAHNLR